MEKFPSKNMKNCNEEIPYYSDEFIPDCRFHHGEVPILPGVECYQVVRANRNNPKDADNTSSTYKHAPDITYYRGKFYIQYLCNPKDEHSGAGYSMLASSYDAKSWQDFKISFPTLKIPCCDLTDYKGIRHHFSGEEYAFMHQRMCFFRSSTDRLLLLGFYGYSPEKWMVNWDNYGIGRVVRELYEDGSMSPIYFIMPCFQAGWNKELLDRMFPYFEEAKDNGFIEACRELLGSELYIQQWSEENGISHFENGKIYQAFCSYHINDTDVIGLWKHSYVSRSNDNGKTFAQPIKSPSLVMSGQKIWGQNCKEYGYYLVYVPSLESTHRYPLCIVHSEDGICFNDMRLICGEVPPMRYAGFWKDFGIQYMRGIYEGLVVNEDDFDNSYLYLTYSVNKEDIWFAKVPVLNWGKQYTYLNIYQPKWTDITYKDNLDNYDICIKDCEPVDYAKVQKCICDYNKDITFHINIENNSKDFYIYAKDEKYRNAFRMIFSKNGKIILRTTADICIAEYDISKEYVVRLHFDCDRYEYAIQITDNNQVIYRQSHLFFAAVNNISIVSFQSGPDRLFPTLDMDPEQYEDMNLEIVEQRKEEFRAFISFSKNM